MNTIDAIAPPEGLSETARAWWESLVRDFEVVSHHLLLATVAAQHWGGIDDRAG